MSNFGGSIRDASKYSPQQKQKMKEIFILYLWDMFQEQDTTITQNTIYIRNAVWQYRDLFFRNRAVFHWMIEMLFNGLWSLQRDEGIILKNKLRDFFLRVMQSLIFCNSPQDLAWLNWQSFPTYHMSNFVFHTLTNSVSVYHDIPQTDHNTDRAYLEWRFVDSCQRRWTEIRPFSQQNIAAFMPRQLSQELCAKIRKLADHTDTHWIPPESREQVVQYIEETYAFNEI